MGAINLWPSLEFGQNSNPQPLNGRRIRVTCLLLLNDRTLLSGSEDDDIKIWDLNVLTSLRSLNETFNNCPILLIRTKLYLISDKSYSSMQERILCGSESKDCLYFNERHREPITCLTSFSKIDSSKMKNNIGKYRMHY